MMGVSHRMSWQSVRIFCRCTGIVRKKCAAIGKVRGEESFKGG
jgi:hypothetical protein